MEVTWREAVSERKELWLGGVGVGLRWERGLVSL